MRQLFWNAAADEKLGIFFIWPDKGIFHQKGDCFYFKNAEYVLSWTFLKALRLTATKVTFLQGVNFNYYMKTARRTNSLKITWHTFSRNPD